MDNQETLEEEQTEDSLLPEVVFNACEKAKSSGYIPYWLIVNGYSFVYRPVNRKEWREFSRDQNRELMAAADDSELHVEIKNQYTEKLVKECLLYSEIPVDDTCGAGYVDTLFDAILVDSGFGQPDMASIRV
jgi:hypothetical protein